MNCSFQCNYYSSTKSEIVLSMTLNYSCLFVLMTMSQLTLLVSYGDYDDTIICHAPYLLMPFVYLFCYLRLKIGDGHVYLGYGNWTHLSSNCKLSVHNYIEPPNPWF